MSKTLSVRLLAAHAVLTVLQGKSLNAILPSLQAKARENERPLLAQLAYGTLRYFHRLDAWLKLLLDKPLKEKDQDVYGLLLVGLYQLNFSRIPSHAALSETVDASAALKKPWAKGLINGVLRSAQRRQDELDAMTAKSPVCEFSHPKWMINTLKRAWPEHYQQILAANNEPAPMTIRVNAQHHTTERYQQLLNAAGIASHTSPFAPQALILESAVAVDKLPDFDQGFASVQDESAQLAAVLLEAQPGDYVLDACCAPGGKTCHLLELTQNLTVDALDSEEERLLRVRDNLQRIKLNARVICNDARATDEWHNGQLYDRILLDAPCSATGVIRRHPDIKLLRKADDIDALAGLQQEILQALWPLLKPGGTMVYATCSVMPQENQQQIETFLAHTPDAQLATIAADWGFDTGFGRQIFPASGDGFFYSRINKAQQQ